MAELAPRRKLHESGLARFEDMFANMLGRLGEPLDLFESTWMPALDVTETDDAILVKAEVPGLKAEDIELSVQNNMLNISGEKKEEHEEKCENCYRSERRYGSFRRTIPLPAEVNADKVEARCKDGVLSITLTKAEPAKSKRIPIKAA